MGFRAFRRIRVLAVSLATVTATTTLFAIAGAAGPAAAATGSGCPGNQKGLATDNNVSASFTNVGTTSTYKFSSLVDEHPSGGVPGLMKYCVYPSPFSQPTVTPQARGDNTAFWLAGTGSNNFAFVRPGGNPSDIGLRGQTVTMGTATWASLAAVPASQAFVLHVNDPGVCASLYGAGSPGTCFVKPRPGPICDHGDSSVAYNALPFDVTNCINPAIGFEATTASEFGNEVNLAGNATAPGRNLSQLKVDFQSFACQSGQWNGVPGDNTTPEPCGAGDTVTPPGVSPGTFNWPITANIYDPNGVGGLSTPIATVTQMQTIPYRPAADGLPGGTGHCTGASGTGNAANRWWNPNAIGGGACQSSIAKVLTFNFAGQTLPNTVVWTVAFNTSDYGPSPQRPAACNIGADPVNFPGLSDGGCPYDSLNVGDNGNTNGAQFPSSHIDNAPYAGADTTPGVAFVNYQNGSFYCPSGGTGGTLQQDGSCWNGLRPLGEIITTP